MTKSPKIKSTALLPWIWELNLYVAGPTPKSLASFHNIERLCEEHVPGRYSIKVIDLTKHPEFAQIDQIVAVPTLVRKSPAPVRKIIGTLSDTKRLLAALDLDPNGSNTFVATNGERNGS